MRTPPPPTTTERRAPRAARLAWVGALAGLVAVAVPGGAGAGSPGATAPGAPGASSGPAAPVALAEPSPDLPGLPPISPDLSSVPVDSPALRRARQGYDAAAAALAGEQLARVQLDRAATARAARERAATTALVSARASAAAASARLEDVDAAIAALAVRMYTSGGGTERLDAAMVADQPSINDADRRAVLASASMDVLLAERAAYQARLEAAIERLEAAEAQLADAERVAARLELERPAAVEREQAAAPPVASARAVYENARALADVDGVGFPLVALDAYHRAAARTWREDPACGVRWWAVAGISRVEGHHGSYGGSSLDVHGNTTKPIIGIPLDGTNQTRVVPDSDGGALDGDPVVDRAVGPMQFIPQTWQRFAADGNDDGVASPSNLYDATLAAARYLCRASRRLDTDAGLRQAYFSYNHSEAYVERVLSFARLYERALALPDPRD